MRKDAQTPEAWGELYRREQGTYRDFAVRLKALLEHLLRAQGIDAVQIEVRAKSVDSFVAKLRRKRDKYDDP
jgi:ppGpp synthetase/RelA/SpoT-type nucleotidyltranferase